jgi:formyltetrahydrofolate deformylase
MTHYILTLSCPDVRGIVASVTSFLARFGGFISESTQFGDPTTERFFMRVRFSSSSITPSAEQLKHLFNIEIATPFSMEWKLTDASMRPRVLILVSKQLHCLNDLLHRSRSGLLAADMVGVISNHDDARSMVEWHGIAYHHLPVAPETKPDQEQHMLAIIEEQRVDVVVLARYMQILSPELSRALHGRAINIHHSFLPSFKGAKPYHQAHARGVKIIGATAHYVTDALDEGPIIEQEVMRVDHSHSPEALTLMGQDIEAQVLSRALKYQIEQRVLMNGNKTVVFK